MEREVEKGDNHMVRVNLSNNQEGRSNLGPRISYGQRKKRSLIN